MYTWMTPLPYQSYIFLFESPLLNIWLFRLDVEKTGRWIWYRKQKLFNIYRPYACADVEICVMAKEKYIFKDASFIFMVASQTGMR